MNNTTDNNIIKSHNSSHYNDCKGTGVLSTIIFAIAVTVIMVVIAYFKGF